MQTKLLSLSWLLLATMVGFSVQQCNIEGFESIALDLVKNSAITSDGDQTITALNDTFYNCLSTSQIIGIYNSMSVSIFFTRSDTPNQLRDVRYNMVCVNGTDWFRLAEQSEGLDSNDTRRNCSACTNQTVNDYHCTRESSHYTANIYRIVITVAVW